MTSTTVAIPGPPAADVRRYPRVLVDEDAHFARPATGAVVARVHDVSPDGLQVVCDRDTMRAFVPPGGLRPDAESPRVLARFSLPLADGRERIDVECRVIHMAVGDGAEFALGLKFSSMSAHSASVLQEFIEQSLLPS